MATDLLFASALNTVHPVNLTFGAGDEAAITYSYLTMSAVVPPPTVSGHIIDVAKLAIVATVPVPAMSASMVYDNAVYRGPAGEAANKWNIASVLAKATEDRVESVDHIHTDKQSVWQPGSVMSNSTSMVILSAISTKANNSTSWKEADQVKSERKSIFSSMLRLRNASQSKNQVAIPVAHQVQSSYQDKLRVPRPTIASTWGLAVKKQKDITTRAGKAKFLAISKTSHWQNAKKPPPGTYTWVTPVIPAEVCYHPPHGLNVPLLFSDPYVNSTDILFYCAAHAVPPATQVVPFRRTYIVINEVSLRRVDGNHILPDVSLSLNIDMDSWTWGFSASLPAATLPLIEPGVSGDPVILEATINGSVYLLLAEGIQRDRIFGKSSITVTGRGQSAMLADPYSPILSFTNTIDRTAQQLMNDALMFNGVTLGWAVDWRIDDWLVPSGVWTYQGSYMGAVTTIAAAAGAFIQPDPVNKTLRVRPRFPAKPWEWNAATPDLELPSAAIVKESIAWIDKPAYNAIYISGSTAGGVLGHVKRIGSAGDVIAPMVTDALITDAIAARQRGLSLLADTGRSATYSLSLPVLPETGIIDPGTLVRYVDGTAIIGVVKSVSISASEATARQTIEVQTYG
ncbi:MAG: hypothetical protein Q7T62_18005 [Undibacterium sp.]|nr:hypothetical protein [Undibacterium sp.]